MNDMSNDEESKTTKFMVYFTYTVVVDAEDYETAEDMAYTLFEKEMASGLHPSDFAVSDAEDVTDWLG